MACVWLDLDVWDYMLVGVSVLSCILDAFGEKIPPYLFSATSSGNDHGTYYAAARFNASKV
jgi:hypothetical protein